MAVFYKVTVEKVETDVPSKDREYQITGKDEDGESKGEYVYYDSTKTVETNIFEQTVEELDMKKLVSVVNGL